MGTILFVACGGSDDEDSFGGDTAAPAPAPAPAPSAAPAPPPAPAPAPAAAPAQVLAQPAPAAPAQAAAAAPAQADTSTLAEFKATDEGDLAKLVQQQRIVVRTVHMALVVSEIQGSMDKVATVAANMGGWTVSSERANDFGGRIAVRVPAERLDEAIGLVRNVAVAVESEITTSEDVTAEYFDSQSRLRNLRATETAMLALLERAPDARDALEIRKTLSEVQEEIEILLGRLKLLEETSAFSLVNVTMRVRRVDLRVDAGDDRTVSIGQTVRFKATFRTPDESASYNVAWNFGDRSEPIFDTFTAPTSESGTRVTASVTHVFDDYRDSPYFVDVKISGTSVSSPLFGQDTIKMTVIGTEQMPVDAGGDQTAAVGRTVRFRAFFEPPEGIDQFTYTWDFGDGSSHITGNRAILTKDSDRMVTAVTSHAFSSAEESPYIVQVKMTGKGEAGIVKGSDKIIVTVTELPVILVSAGESMSVEGGTDAVFRGTLNRPAGVTNLKYRWTFGDGTAPEEGDIGDENVVEVSHNYVHLRQQTYTATFTVMGDSEAGPVEASSSISVHVVEGEGWVVGGYSLKGTTKDAVRSLSVLVKGLTTTAIWIAVFSPFWGGGLAVLVVLGRFAAARRRRRTRQPEPEEPQVSGEEPAR